MAISLVALCGPAVSAFIVAALSGGGALRDLRDRIMRWRVPFRWYAIALLTPIAASGLARAIEILLGAPATIHFLPITGLQLVVFVLVAGEEIGWRGFLLPRLLARQQAPTASLVVGFIWAVWHFPLFLMPAMPQYGGHFPAFVVYTTALSVLLTRLSQVSQGSVVLATVFHGAVNTFGWINDAATPLQQGWANALAYGVIAALAVRKAPGTREPENPRT